MTAASTLSPRYASASALSFCRIIALISGGLYSLPPASTRASPFWPEMTLYETIDSSSRTSASLRPMKRLMEKTVFCGLVTAWRLATVPTRRSPDCVNATTDGVVRPPSAFSITVGSPPSSTAMHEFVVPRSIPMVLPMWENSLFAGKSLGRRRKAAFASRLTEARCGTKSQSEYGRSSRWSLVAGEWSSAHPPGAHPAQQAIRAIRALGVAGAAAVAQRVEMQLELGAAWRNGDHLVVELLERGAGPQQPQPLADPRHVGVHGHIVRA